MVRMNRSALPLVRGPVRAGAQVPDTERLPLSTITRLPFGAEHSVSVQLHPVSSLGLGASTPPSLQGGPDEQCP
jgi:hypothetical protein